MRIFRGIVVAITVAFALKVNFVQAQIITQPGTTTFDTDSVRAEFDNGPYFTLYKDNYFIAGTTLGGRPNKTNSDVKFQISIAQRITKSVLPFNSYLFLMYTQKCMWNVFEESLPMRDLNFNPGIGLTKLLIVKGTLVGKATLLVEHESNGRDGLASRSWNRVSLGASIFIEPNVMIHGKTWIPIIDGENNKDILDYCGIYQTGVSVTSQNRRFQASVILTKRRGWNLNFNTVIELSYRIFKKDNQSFFLQYYNGYGENLLDYNRFHSRLRVGIVIKPKLFSDF
ncbi:MAG: phospholipase A [Muribaculaceae bacterium]|nr:phospholipase A [Muribaculaceae bacterium]